MKRKIQSKLEALAHPEIRSNEDWLELWFELKTMARLLHSTNNKEENIKVGGQYKTQVLSRYHRPTQNRKQYISDNIIKSTTILNMRHLQLP